MKLIICCFVMLVSSLLPVQESKTFQQLKQLQGTWKMQTPRRTTYENWTITGAQLTGKSYILRGTDTVILERVKLEETTEGIFYTPTVTDQNQGKPVSFKLVSSDNMTFTFENKEHDFPQRINYHILSADSLHAWIEGTKNGRQGRFDYHFRKQN